MKLPIKDIVVDERIRQSLGDIESLATDMRINGQIVPITVRIAEDGMYHLVAGFRRMKAMEMNGETDIEAYAIVEDDEEMLLLKEISENEIRETFTRTERMGYIRRLDEIEAKRAEERMLKGKADPMENSPQGATRDIVAEQVGISSNTIAREKKIIEHKDEIDPEDFKNWDEGKLSTNKVFTELKAKLKAAEDALKKKPKEVAPADYELLKESVKELTENNTKLWNERKELVADKKKWQKLYEESGYIEPSANETAKKDIDALTKGIIEFLGTYGGKAWAIDRKEYLQKYRTEALQTQARNLYAFAQNLYEITKGEEE